METIRFNVWNLRPDRREAVIAWLLSMDLKPDDYAARAAIVAGERGWELHLSRYVRNEQGTIRLDLARNDVVTEPVIAEIGPERKWPDLGPESGGWPATVHLKAPDRATARACGEAVVDAIEEYKKRGRA